MSWNGDRSSRTRNKIEISGASELIERYARISSQSVLQLGKSVEVLLKIAEQLEKEQQGKNVENKENNLPKLK